MHSKNQEFVVSILNNYPNCGNPISAPNKSHQGLSMLQLKRAVFLQVIHEIDASIFSKEMLLKINDVIYSDNSL